jgi:phosphoserine phosphatase RsbU/P
MINKNTLSFRVSTRVLGFSTALFVIILSIFYYFARVDIHDSSQRNAVALAESAVAKIEQELRQLEKIPHMLATLMEIDPIERDSISSILQAIVAENKNIYGSAMAFEPDFYPDKGLYFAPYAYRDGDSLKRIMLGGESYEYFYMDWYQIPVTLQTTYWTEPYFDEGGGENLFTTYSVPFNTTSKGERKLSGVVTVDLSLEWLRDIVNSVQIFDTGYAFLLSKNGTIITHPNMEYVMNESMFSIALERENQELWDIGLEMQTGVSRFREHGITFEGERLWIYYTPIQSSDWSLGVVYPDREMFASLHSITVLMIFLTIGGLIILSFFTVLGVNKIIAPVTEFAKSARIIADGDFGGTLPEVVSKDELLELHDSFSHMQQELAKYVEHLRETTVAKEKIESELRIARDIQLSMIPSTFPPYPDLPQVDLFAFLKSAREVGGDLYDFFLIDKTKFCFAIGDVSGKGVPASLFMAVTRTLLRTIADKVDSPGEIVNILNKSLTANKTNNMFVTFFLGILDLETGQLNYCNAGHNQPFLVKKGGEVIKFNIADGIPLGFFSSYEYPESTMILDPGDKIVAYTDGVSEAEKSEDDMYSEDDIETILRANTDKNPKEIVHVMLAEIEHFVGDYPQSDDITMLAVSYNGK